MHHTLLALLAAVLPQDPALPVPVQDLDALQARFDELAGEPQIRAFEYGTSRSGNPLQALEVARGEPADVQPALLVVAGLTQSQAWTAGLALDLTESLIDSDLTETTRVVVVPLANPDAYASRFLQPAWETSATGPGADQDRDGREGEDPPADVNGDGFVTWMRVPDPQGVWMADPQEARLLIEADPLKGERGLWKLVREGFDLDGDGEAAEDAERNAEVNRNFAAGWEEHQPRAGRYPSHEPATRGLMQLVVDRPDIQAVLVIGDQDNLIALPTPIPDDAPANNRVPKAGLRQSDADQLGRLAERWKEVTELDAAGDAVSDDAGTFQAWTYAHRGLLTLATRPWSVPEIKPAEDAESSEAASAEGAQATVDPETEEADAPELSPEAKQLHWLEENGRPNAHLGWTTFEHPQLGTVEIGGYRPFVRTEPISTPIDGLGGRMANFLKALGPELARIEFADARTEDLGSGLLDVRVALVNSGRLPLRSKWGERTRTQRLPRVELVLPEGATLIAGSPETIAGNLGGGERQEFRWLVQGASPTAITVTASTDHAGLARTTFEDQQ